MKRRIISITLFCLYIAAVAYLCFAKPDGMPELPTEWFGLPADKVAHFLMFLPYPVLAGLSFISHKQKLGWNIVVLMSLAAVGIGMAYGTEVIQSHTEYRSYEIEDFYADLIGIGSGVIIAITYLIYIKLKK